MLYFPKKIDRIFTRKKSKIMIAMCWLVAFLAILPSIPNNRIDCRTRGDFLFIIKQKLTKTDQTLQMWTIFDHDYFWVLVGWLVVFFTILPSIPKNRIDCKTRGDFLFIIISKNWPKLTKTDQTLEMWTIFNGFWPFLTILGCWLVGGIFSHFAIDTE